MSDIVIDDLKSIIDSNHGVSFSDDHIAILVTDEDLVEWEDLDKIDVDSLIDGEWSTREPDDGDYGSIVLEPWGDMVTDDFDLNEKSVHRFRKKF